MPKKSIVVVEDDQTIRENLKEFLDDEGYIVQTAQNGKEGLRIIRELKGDCLVLLDLQMPVMTGEQLLEELFNDSDSRLASTLIVIITARAEPVKYQVHAMLRKPLDLDLLLETVEKFV